MVRGLKIGMAVAALALIGLAPDVGVSSAQAQGSSAQPAEHPSANAYRKRGPQVRGYVLRGGYSYGREDSINTYGDSRSRYGGASFYRDTMLDRQSRSGPFDHGFFFDSAIGRGGGNAPYQH